MVTNLLRFLHAVVIIQILVVIFKEEICPIWLFGAEFLMTVIRAFTEKKYSSTRVKVQVILSLLVGYSAFPNKHQQVSWLFFLKSI